MDSLTKCSGQLEGISITIALGDYAEGSNYGANSAGVQFRCFPATLKNCGRVRGNFPNVNNITLPFFPVGAAGKDRFDDNTPWVNPPFGWQMILLAFKLSGNFGL